MLACPWIISVGWRRTLGGEGHIGLEIFGYATASKMTLQSLADSVSTVVSIEAMGMVQTQLKLTEVAIISCMAIAVQGNGKGQHSLASVTSRGCIECDYSELRI